MIARYGPCICITIFRFLRWKLELCYAPADYSPPEHVHKNSDGEFFVIFGRWRYIYRMVTRRGYGGAYLEKQQYNVDDRKYFKWFSVRAGTPHGFSCGSTPMIWLCFEHWKPGVKVTSVAEDFVLT